jgi:hypothetical protein
MSAQCNEEHRHFQTKGADTTDRKHFLLLGPFADPFVDKVRMLASPSVHRENENKRA